MNDTSQIKAIAELDGWRKCNCREQPCEYWINEESNNPKSVHWCNSTHERALPNYLNSYDAIIPVIQKLGLWPQIAQQMVALKAPTPHQLCEALLRATKIWKE